ncbi:MAG TPA: hypothetical protein VLA90_07090 [Actinomycetota bacterium]|nr:hypothetical protein [Actinomycetota bacterium]
MGRPIVRALLAAAIAGLPAAACAPTVEGPAAAIASEQMTTGTAFDASASRQRVLDFVAAYASSPTDGAESLLEMVGGAELTSWVRWLNVQHREFPGAIEARAEIRDVEFVGEVPVDEDLVAAQVALSASVVFRFSPEREDAFDRIRILDGPVNVVQTEDRIFVVVDLLRDGVSMSDGIQLFERLGERVGPLEVIVDSLHMFPPNWQFNVVIQNRGGRPLGLRRELSGLHVRTDAGFERFEGTATRSLETIPPGGRVEGIVAYPMQDSPDGRVLTLAYGRGKEPLRFDFPLDGLVSVAPSPPPGPASG